MFAIQETNKGLYRVYKEFIESIMKAQANPLEKMGKRHEKDIH